MAAEEVTARGTMHPRAAWTRRRHGWNGMQILQPDTGLPVGSGVDMTEVASEVQGVLLPTNSSGLDVNGAYALVLEA